MWLIPLKEKGHSGCCIQNFLWKKNNIYIMDNHRAALWCWFQHIDKKEKINFLHIDQHTDTLQCNINKLIEKCPDDLSSLSLQEYLSYIFEKDTESSINPLDVLLFRWDTYGSIFLGKFKSLIDNCIFITFEGDEPNFDNILKPSEELHQTVVNNIDNFIEQSEHSWIVNIDLDYFFDESNQFEKRFSDEYIEKLFITIKKHLQNDNILCFTLALSPEFCGSWEASEKLLANIVKILEIDFSL